MAKPAERRPATQSRDEDRIDRSLLARIAEGDHAALRELYLRYYQRLLRFLYRLTGRFELAEEALNDVMLVVWTKAASFGGRSTVSTWIMGIAYRKGLKALEGSRRWTDRFKAGNLEDWNEPLEDVEEPNREEVTQDLLASALARLSPEHRAVIELTYFHGYSYREIGSIAGCPVNTVKTRMFHARARLRELLPKLGADGPVI